MAGRAQGRRCRLLRRLLVLMLVIVAGVALIPALRLYTVMRYRGAVHGVADVPLAPVALVFGAGLDPDGRPSLVLQDRVTVAVELYEQGKVGQLLLSGDGRDPHWSEPEVMRRMALDLGVPEEALLLDDGGLRTQESCTRAHDEFGVTRAILVSQRFHLPRALLLCRDAGMQADGVASDLHNYGDHFRRLWAVRESAATVAAWWDVITDR